MIKSSRIFFKATIIILTFVFSLNLNFMWTCCLCSGEYFGAYADAENKEWLFGLSVLFSFVKFTDIVYLQFLDLHAHAYNDN